MGKLSLETRNKITIDLQNNINYKDIMNTYNVSRATVFRIKKENITEKITETTNNETEDDDNETEDKEITINETEDKQTEEDNNSEDEKSTVNQFNIEQFKKELNNTLNSLDNEEDNQTAKNNISVASNNQSVISKKSVIFKKKPEIIKPQNINDKNSIFDTIKNVNVANDIDELKEIRTTIIIIKQYINTFEKDLKSIYGNNRYVFEKKLFTLQLNQLKIILEDIRITINLKSNKSSFLTISQGLIKGIETISCYSGYDVSGLEEQLMSDPDFILDLQIIAAETDLSKYLNPRSSAFLKVVKKMYMLNTQNKMKKTISDINENKDLINKIKDIQLKK